MNIGSARRPASHGPEYDGPAVGWPAVVGQRSSLPWAVNGVHLKHALFNPRPHTRGFASKGLIIRRDVARRRMVISQVEQSVPGLIDPFVAARFVHHDHAMGPIYRCGALDRLRPGSVSSTGSTPPLFLNDVSTKLLSDTDVCEFDAVIIVDHPGVSPNMSCLSLPTFLGRPEKPVHSYTRPIYGHSPHPLPSQLASKARPHPFKFPTCTSHLQVPSQTTALFKTSQIS